MPPRRHLCVGLLRNSVVADAADGPRFLLTHVEDIEERKRRELQLAHRASHDSLTGLPNSAELRSRLSARLCSQQPQSALPTAVDPMEPYESFDSHDAAFGPPVFDRGHDFDFPPGSDTYDGYDHHVHTVAPAAGADDGTKGLAVLFCDLDGFKSINDRFGHNAGDAVLIEVARRLSNGVRDGDTVARLGVTNSSSSPTGSAGPTRRTSPYGCATRSSSPSGPRGGPCGSAPASASDGPTAA